MLSKIIKEHRRDNNKKASISIYTREALNSQTINGMDLPYKWFYSKIETTTDFEMIECVYRKI